MPGLISIKAPSVCFIGAGFSGMCGAIKIQQELGINNFDVFEMNKDLGGTWFANSYPGCACDIPIHGYCYSFAKCSDWRAQYATHAEILQYMKKVAVKYGLYSKIFFQHAVKRLKWDNELQQWNVTIEDIKTKNVFSKNYDICIPATGSIRLPKTPEQFKDFQGPIVHTAFWNSLDLNNKRVAVIGNGASGVQVIPQVSKVASELYVFQRTPSWIFPKLDFEFGTLIKWCFRWIPGILALYRIVLLFLFDLMWQAMKKKSWASKQFTAVCNWHRKKQLGDRKDLIARMTPNFDFGCKRTAFAQDYYPVFTKPSTTLVTSNISHINKNTISTIDGQMYEVDVLVLATGFSITDYFLPMEIIDKNGESVLQNWRTFSPSLFLGIASHSLPNLFILYGPNTSTGHNSVVLTVEMQMDWVVKCLREMMNRRAKVVSIKASAERNYMKKLKDQLSLMVWDAQLCSSWYTDEKGRNTMIFPWSLAHLRKRVQAFDFNQLEFQ